VNHDPYRVMTVCTGNICRSPMAEIVLRDRLDAAGLGDRVLVDSGGVSDEEAGNPVDRRARRVLAEHGYPTGDGHRARQVTAADVASHDLVLAMTAHHARALRRLGPDAADGRIRMYRSFDPQAPVVRPGESEHVLDVDDPWYGDLEDFEHCLTEIEAAADGVVELVRSQLAARERSGTAS
jgi:protein-tyrosine phosphatase